MASEVSGVDDGVGEIMAALKANGLEENTLVVYASDQGWMGGQNGMWGMGDHFRPIGAHELMMQIPLIFRQPGTIPPAQTCDALVSNYDFMPSVLAHLGLGDKMPQQPKSPGRDFSPALRGQPLANWDSTVFYEMETTRATRAIRAARWKYVARFPAGPMNSTTCRNASVNTASPARRRFRIVWRRSWMLSSIATPIRSMTSGKAVARRRSGMCREWGL